MLLPWLYRRINSVGEFCFALCSLALFCVMPNSAAACPFCTAVSQTFSEEMDSMDVVAFAKLIKQADLDDTDEMGELAPSEFEVVEIVKGDDWVEEGQRVEMHFFGSADKDELILIMGSDPPQLMWGSPLPVSDRGRAYLKSLVDLPDGPERLEFFLDYLEDEDEVLTRDAYDEFAKQPYEAVIALKDKMDRQQILAWIKDRDIPASRRRLYLTMLGVCGTDADARFLTQLMKSDKREDKAGLNAMIACYLSLRKEAGLGVIEELFLRNKDAEYADTYAAIMALRFHGNDNDVIPKEKLLPGLRFVLEREDLADLVIPDLARWEDWSVKDRLVQLFKNANPQTNFVRVPVVNYLRACPEPDAQVALKELEAIDPEAVQRASTFFPFTQFAGPKRGDSPGAATDEIADGAADGAAADEPVDQEIPAQGALPDVASMPPPDASSANSNVATGDRSDADPSAAEFASLAANPDKNDSAAGGSRWAWSVPIVAGLVALVYLGVRFAIR